MTIKDLQEKYTGMLKVFIWKGIMYKILLTLLLIPASLYIYCEVVSYNSVYNKGGITNNTIIIITVLLYLILAISVITINTMLFVNTAAINSFNSSFKKDLFIHFQNEIPELLDYRYNQKISDMVFYESELFNDSFTDYNGDDWMHGRYKNLDFSLCELHVFSLFKQVFNGIFVSIFIENSLSNTAVARIKDLEEIEAHISTFEEKYNSHIKVSHTNNHIYLALGLEGYFFENSGRAAINKLEKDVEMLKNIMSVIRIIIDKHSYPE